MPRTLVLAVLVSLVSHNLSADFADRNWLQISRVDPETGRTLLITDLPSDDAWELLNQLELFDRLVDEFIEPFVPLARKIAPELAGVERLSHLNELRLVVLSRRKDFNRLFRSGHFAAFTIPTLEKTTLLVGPMGSRGSLGINLLHEYVHYRLRRDVPGGLPLWYEEGLASYLSLVDFSQEKSDAGAHTYELGFWHLSDLAPDMPLKKLINRRDLQGMSRAATSRFYRTAHALVRHLYAEVNVNQDLLASSLVFGDPAFPAGANVNLKSASVAMGALAKPSWSRQEMPKSRRAKARLKEVRQRGSIQVSLNGGSDLNSAGAEESALAANEVRYVLAEAALLMNAEVSERLFERILKAQPENILASLGYAQSLRLQTKHDVANQVLTNLEKGQSGEPRLLMERAALSTSGCIIERRQECQKQWRAAVVKLRDVLDAQPDNFEAVYRLGLAYLYSGQPGEGLAYLEIAWRRVPWSPRVNYFIGEALRLLGDSRARWYLTNAQRWAASDYFRQSAKASLAELDS